MAAGPVQVTKDFIETLDKYNEKLKEMDHALDYAPGLGVLELQEWETVDKYVEDIQQKTEELMDVLNEIQNNYPDQIAEDFYN